MKNCLLLLLMCLLCATVGCAKFRGDYFRHPTARYQPEDPWTRSWVRHYHTGHAGLFYNCDCEERKRFSPYICWKHADVPCTGETIRKNVRRDLCRIKQRIHDGACITECSCCTKTECACEYQAVQLQMAEHETIENAVVPVVSEPEDPLELIRSKLHGSEFTVNVQPEAVQPQTDDETFTRAEVHND